MTPSKEELQKMNRDDIDTIASRILDALPDDPGCCEAFQNWRAAQQEIFNNPNPSIREQYQKEQELFSALMMELSLAGVTAF